MEKKIDFIAHGHSYSIDAPAIMGVINCTPDSFLAESRVQSDTKNKITKWIHSGIDIIDIGGQSTRPGATFIEPEMEWERVQPWIEWIRKEFPNQLISIDTFHPSVAQRALSLGVQIINDVSAGQWTKGMIDVLKDNQVVYILMHSQGKPEDMQRNPSYENITLEVIDFLKSKSDQVKSENPLVTIWADPGFGFGKTFEHNQQLLQNLDALQRLSLPILVGMSRKKMIQQCLNTTADGSEMGSHFAHLIALTKGASIVRTHDVEHCLTLKKIYQTFNS